MKRTISVGAVLLMALLLVSCYIGRPSGRAIQVGPSEQPRSSAQISPSEQSLSPEPTPDSISDNTSQPIQYGDFTLDLEFSCENESDLGFITGIEIIVWRSQLAYKEYSHPACADYTIPDEYPSDWRIFPILVNVTNLTNGWDSDVLTTFNCDGYEVIGGVPGHYETGVVRMYGITDSGVAEIPRASGGGPSRSTVSLKPNETIQYFLYLVAPSFVPQGPTDNGRGGSFHINNILSFSFSAASDNMNLIGGPDSPTLNAWYRNIVYNKQ